MQAIPPEVLGEVFARVVPHTPLDERGRDQLIHLNLVCKSWRAVALQTHQLWGRVQVPIDPLFDYDYDKAITWLNRAGATSKEVLSENRSKFQNPCLCTKVGARHYWCHFENAGLVRFFAAAPLDRLILPSSPSSCFGNFIRKLGTFGQGLQSLPWNSIRQLTLSFGRGYYVEPTRTSGSIFNSLPSALTSLNLTIASSDNQLRARYEIPPSSLGRLKMFKIDCHWDAAYLADVLHYCTGVQSLGIRHRSAPRRPASHIFKPFTRYTREGGQAPSPTAFHHLYSLDVDIHDPLDAAYILCQIQAPNLLNICIHNDDSTSNPRGVHNYLDYLNIFNQCPSNPSIQSLTIYEQFTTEPSKIDTLTVLIPILANLPSLSHFSLDRVSFDADKIVSALQTYHKGVHIAPQLRTIELVSPGDNITLKSLLEYVRMRRSTCTESDTLKRIELRSLQDENPRLRAEYRKSSVVQDLLDMGVVVDAYL